MSTDPATITPSLPGVRVGISISTFPGDDLPARGLSDQHVDHMFFELVRQLLAAGASIAYGGDLREQGFTMKLIALLNRYSDASRPSRRRVVQYMAWPRSQRDHEKRSRLMEVATVHPVPPPVADPPNPLTFDAAASPENRALNARCLTEMRLRMTAETDARVVLGGRTAGHESRYPGVAEEAYLAARARQPLYVLAAFGGCGACVGAAIRGERPDELTRGYQLRHTDGYDELVDQLADLDEENLVETLRGSGPPGVPNGLTAEENDRLLEAVDLDEVVALVLRGLRNRPRAG